MLYWFEIPKLMRGKEYGSIFIDLDEKVRGPEGEILPNDYFKKNGIAISIKYENMWTREEYSEDWEVSHWTIEDHKNDKK